nr:hypothetical protein BaRGS_002842 [Batillaria attramentaria]
MTAMMMMVVVVVMVVVMMMMMMMMMMMVTMMMMMMAIGKYIELTLDRLNAKSELLESKDPASYATVLELA